LTPRFKRSPGAPTWGISGATGDSDFSRGRFRVVESDLAGDAARWLPRNRGGGRTQQKNWSPRDPPKKNPTFGTITGRGIPKPVDRGGGGSFVARYPLISGITAGSVGDNVCRTIGRSLANGPQDRFYCFIQSWTVRHYRRRSRFSWQASQSRAGGGDRKKNTPDPVRAFDLENNGSVNCFSGAGGQGGGLSFKHGVRQKPQLRAILLLRFGVPSGP